MAQPAPAVISFPVQPPAPPGLGPILLVTHAYRHRPQDVPHWADIIKDLWAREMGYLRKRHPSLPKKESLWTREHVRWATWWEDGDFAIELYGRITHQRLLHRLTQIP